MAEKRYMLNALTRWTSVIMFNNRDKWSKLKHWKVAKNLVRRKEDQEVVANDVQDEMIEQESVEEQQQLNNCSSAPANTASNCRTCDICQKEFRTPSHLNRHLRTHTGEKPFPCRHCGKSFAQKENLTRHIRTHTDQRLYSCDLCEYAATKKSDLTCHMRTHTGKRPYCCDYCGHSSARKFDLKNHIRTHTGERPYSCDLCNKTYTQKSHLTDHMHTHTGVRPHTCDYCDYSSVRMFDLKKHILRKHTSKGNSFTKGMSLSAYKASHATSIEKRYGCEFCEERFHRQADWTKHFRNCGKAS